MTSVDVDRPRAREGDAGALFTLTDRLFRAGALDEVYTASLDAIEALLGCQRASILLFDDNGVMRFVSWRGLSDEYRQAVDGHSPWVAGQRVADPIFVPDIQETDEPEWLKQRIASEGIVGLAFVPLFASGEVVGKFMTYFPTRHDFTEHDRSALSQSLVRLVSVLSATVPRQRDSTRFAGSKRARSASGLCRKTRQS